MELVLLRGNPLAWAALRGGSSLRVSDVGNRCLLGKRKIYSLSNTQEFVIRDVATVVEHQGGVMSVHSIPEMYCCKLIWDI